jgi:hypothetical protein
MILALTAGGGSLAGTGDMVYTQDRREGLQIRKEWLFNE